MYKHSFLLLPLNTVQDTNLLNDWMHWDCRNFFAGDIFLRQELDREKGATYTLPISAVSHNNPVDRISTNVIVNVIDTNDNTPEFEKVCTWKSF